MRLAFILKIILLVVIGLGTLAVNVTGYLSFVKNTSTIGVQPTEKPTVTLSPTTELTTTPTLEPTVILTPTPIQQQTPTSSVIPKKELQNILLSLPFHNSDKVLQVYTPEPSSDICMSADDLYCIARGLSVDTELKLTVYDVKNKSSVFLGNIQLISKTGIRGGLFVPFAITKDDNNIILKAHMTDPGAGGGSVDYGYAMIPIKSATNEDLVINDFSPIANWSAVDFPFVGGSIHFYDSYGKVVYTDESDKTPHYSAPPYLSNDGVIMFRSLITNNEKKILEEIDTSYEIVSINEINKIMKFKATK